MTKKGVASHKGIQNFTIIVILGIGEICFSVLFRVLRKRGAFSI